ncbi:transcriptional regulator with XRE-family HTH domain [Streptosporangium album]|uniref:Transcriptional regulator with XRE-family HTH domain n=1 Tax=Streptosporangium album TaxID=47479 RepID=A0A7W7W8I9_9ACTN|nr:helix-turn-helix transcriptional regulator [Streptosporangium album]MBB4937035.1 transcriptional regulator with XRE-family HTH domain [Streptosporangium album]
MATSTRIDEAKGILAARLRALRSDAGLTGRALAARTGMDHTKISKIENAVQMPNQTDIRAWCKACSADEQVVDLIAAAQNIDAMYTEWRRLEETGLGRVQRSFQPLYEKTRRFRVWQHSAIPGLLQTSGYARGHLRTVIDFRNIPDDIDAAVAARLRQQGVLRDGTKRFAFIVGEQALRTPLVGPAEMAAQLDRLTELTDGVANLSFGIIPARAKPSMMPPENFWIYDAARVRVDTVPGQIQHKAPSDVAVYEKAFEALHTVAVYGQAAREVLRTVTGEFRAT